MSQFEDKLEETIESLEAITSLLTLLKAALLASFREEELKDLVAGLLSASAQYDAALGLLLAQHSAAAKRRLT